MNALLARRWLIRPDWWIWSGRDLLSGGLALLLALLVGRWVFDLVMRRLPPLFLLGNSRQRLAGVVRTGVVLVVLPVLLLVWGFHPGWMAVLPWLGLVVAGIAGWRLWQQWLQAVVLAAAPGWRVGQRVVVAGVEGELLASGLEGVMLRSEGGEQRLVPYGLLTTAPVVLFPAGQGLTE
ncbi:MAG: hypothetical protein HQL56_19520 [Magnetococcales bacterium]|nr:hypothetical protein [Magnetococcales bacterium]